MDNNNGKKSSEKLIDNADTTNSDVNKKLLEIRDSIDAIDDQFLQLLSQRAECAEKVAQIKRETGEVDLWFYRPEREAQILNRVTENNPLVWPWNKALKSLFLVLTAPFHKKHQKNILVMR